MDPTIKPEDLDSNTPTLTPSTPQKRTKNQQTTEDPDSPTKKPKTKSPSKRNGPLGPIPATYDEAGEADKAMLCMRGENKPWAEVKEVMEGIIGEKLVVGSITTRYARIKANLVVFEKEDEPILIQSKKDIEEKLEVEKWQRIADSIEAKSGHKYPVAVVQKKFKEMSKKGDAME